ncbi:MAG: AraC family transcriptional regulator [Oscillospiraceae bacterium]|nr:AraC family transcriptional regulator [Oscillospiraceae bacterium]
MAFATQYLIDADFQDLNPISYGWSIAAPGDYDPPSKRNGFCLHFVRSGKGTLHCNGKNYPVKAGQAFLMHFGEVCSHTADADDPWQLSWVGFSGRLSGGFSALPSVFDVPHDLLHTLRSPQSETDTLPYELASDLFMLHARLVQKRKKKRDYAQILIERIQSSYQEKLSVEQMADELGLDRRYLVSIFKKQTGFTIQQYILRIRLQAAKQYLQKGYSVQEAAKLSGFNDVYNFSRLFTREEGYNPSTFKKIVSQMKKEAEEKLK